MDNAAERLEMIRVRIEKARRRFGPPVATGVSRDAPTGAVTLVAVSKTFPAEDIVPFLKAGQRVFGENRVQEAEVKWPGLRASYDGIELHLIGPLQSNKAREAVALFDVIETVDRDKIAMALKAEMVKQGRRPRLLVQVNIGMEAQKAGINPGEAVLFVQRCRDVHELAIEGLMAIPPEGAPAGPYFAGLAALAEAANVRTLSMGMSGDFETGIAMGATHVRIGSLLFGNRG